MIPLHRMILETVVYYDVFDYPLTEFEVWQLLIASDGDGEMSAAPSLREVGETLDGSFLSKRLSRSQGFVFVRGRERLVFDRIQKGKRADRDIRRAKRVARVFSALPFVRMAGLTGSLSMKNPERESDWDFFVVLEAGHIWTGRAFATLVLHLLGMRRHGKKIRNRACLNFWVTTDSLEIRLKDIFSSNEYMFLIPLFDDGVFDQFQSANRWMKRFRPNFAPAFLPHRSRVRDTTLTQKIRGLGETVLSSRRLEAFLRKIQHKKIARNPKTALSEGIIEANDARLVFLPKPQGPKVFEAFRRRLSEVETIALS